MVAFFLNKYAYRDAYSALKSRVDWKNKNNNLP